MAPVEKRIDPEDGQAYTWEELSAFYTGKYKKKEIGIYWETCKVAAKAKAKGKGKAKAEPKTKAKAKPEPKTKAKAKAKVKAKKEGSSLPKKDVKLHYWPARGRGEMVRLALVITGVPFEDVTFDLTDEASKTDFFAKCKELGGNSTNNTPMLEVKGKFFTQSIAVVKYVCACGGLSVDSPKLGYNVDNIIMHVEDLKKECYKPIKMMGGTDKEKEVFIQDALPKHLGNLERLLGEKKYFAHSKMTTADILVYDVLDTFVETQVPGVLEASFPKLKAFWDKMSELPAIKKWHESEQFKKLWAFPAL